MTLSNEYYSELIYFIELCIWKKEKPNRFGIEIYEKVIITK